MKCDLQEKEGRLVCAKCGFTMRYIEGRVYRECDASNDESEEMSSSRLEALKFPSLAEQAIHFASDMIQWGQAGFPVSKRDERERRIEICRGCEMFVDGRCSECGCACGWASFLETKQCPHPNGDKWEKDRLERIEHAVPQQ